MIIPPFLKPGDTIAICAPARKISERELEYALDVFYSWGLKVKFSNHLFGAENQFSGSDKERLHDLQQLINDPSVQAIISARGGYGTSRIIDELDCSALLKHPKWIVGYSDITVLHNKLNNLGVATLHGTMPISFKKNEEALDSLYNALFGKPLVYHFPSHCLNKVGTVQGIISGGNLSLLYAQASTPTEINPASTILFIEDLDEYLYHTDRMLGQLYRSGKLANLKGLLSGSFTDMKDNTIPFGLNAEEIIYSYVKQYHYPCCFNAPAGHLDKNLALYFGIEARLEINTDNVKLSFPAIFA